MLKSFTVVDDINRQYSGAIEVIVEFTDGRRRWCYFMTPEALVACGDLIRGSQTRIHYAAPYMIVVGGVLDEQVIELSLRHIDNAKKLEACTMALDAD